MIPIKINNIDDIAMEHYLAIEKHFAEKKRGYSYNSIDTWFKNHGARKSFKDVILAKPRDLLVIKNAYKSISWPKEITHINTGLYRKYFSSTTCLKGTDYNSAKLVEKLGLTVCPYCNRNYINNINQLGGQIKKTSQIDHFHSKTKHPYLAMSFYNLIPSCYSCNHVKGEAVIDYSPYNSIPDSYNLMSFKLNPESIVNVYDQEKVSFDIVINNSIIEQNINTFLLKSQYQLHNDVVQEIILKRKMYTELKIEELTNDFELLFDYEIDIEKLLYNNYLNEKSWHKRPLSKLTSDILNELRLDDIIHR